MNESNFFQGFLNIVLKYLEARQSNIVRNNKLKFLIIPPLFSIFIDSSVALKFKIS